MSKRKTTFKKTLKFPDGKNCTDKDLLAFYIQLVEPEFYYFEDLVSLLSYCIKNNGLTSKQIDWANKAIIPKIHRIYMNKNTGKTIKGEE
jgi:hypothetical protein